MAEIVHQLYFCREVKLYKIPPRLASGHRSGDWQVGDNIFTGRLRLVAIGTLCKVILEESNGTEFATCPIPLGEGAQAVEPATDSSRYFVLRLMDQANPQRRAFVGLGFTDRAEAFDFNVALSDHEKHTRRSQEVEEAAQQSAHSGRGSAAGPGPNSQLNTDAARLYQSRDLSLKDGETIKIKMPGSSGASKMQPRAQGLPTVSLPPPQQSRAPTPAPTQAPPQAEGDLLGLLGLSPPASGTTVKPSSKPSENWATF